MLFKFTARMRVANPFKKTIEAGAIVVFFNELLPCKIGIEALGSVQFTKYTK